MASRRAGLAAFLLFCVSSQLAGQEQGSWVINEFQYANLSNASLGQDCNCQLVSCPACQKPDAWDDQSLAAPPADSMGSDAAEPAPILDDYDLIASNYGATPGSMSARPAMIGDFFGGAYTMRLPDLQSMGTFQGAKHVNVPLAGGDRRFKIGENNSPFPVDRYFVNYNRFHNALLTADERQANLNRVVVGVEKTFHDGLCSFEIRLPFSNGLNSVQAFNSTANNVAGEFGNIAFALKGLLYQGQTVSWSAGLGMVIPTADNSEIFDESSRLFATVENQAFYLQPFAGMLWTPNDRLFAQFLMQFDFDTTGNRVRFDGLSGASGVVQDQALLFMDASFGYWLYRSPFSGGHITGIAPMLELHHTTTLEDSDSFSVTGVTGQNTFSNEANRLDVLNITGGVRIELHGNAYLTIAAVAPLREGLEHLFDTEVAAQYVGFY